MSEKADTSDEQVVNVFTAEAIDNLTEGFLNALQPEVLRVEQSLNELISNQDEMLTSIQTKRSQFEDPTLSKDITSLVKERERDRHRERETERERERKRQRERPERDIYILCVVEYSGYVMCGSCPH
jgi:hypothetical protein